LSGPSPRARRLIGVLRAGGQPVATQLRALLEAADIVMPGPAVILAAHAQQGKHRVSVEAMRQPFVPPRPEGIPEEVDVLDLFAVLAGCGFAVLEENGALLVMGEDLLALLSR
jgi:hypothetical protein